MNLNPELTVYVLILNVFFTDVSCETLNQPASLILQPGQRLTIRCQVSYSLGYYTAWIRQAAGKGLEWIGMKYTGGSLYKDSLKNKFSIDLDTSSSTVTLNGQNMQPEDSAVYYSAELYKNPSEPEWRTDTSSYGTILVSIGMLWSATGLQITHSSLHSTSLHTLHFGIRLKSSSLPGAGTVIPINASAFYRLWREHVGILIRHHVRPGYDVPLQIFPCALDKRTLHVM
uniref:Ig-like domain-containing protein n=1 Tax=Cyprinodon variegatus TaxID=28743 RepID=A0A3Q2G7U3_CYPVA